MRAAKLGAIGFVAKEKLQELNYFIHHSTGEPQ
jgi:hypothetical protein